MVQVVQEAEQVFRAAEQEPSREAAEGMDYTVACLKVCLCLCIACQFLTQATMPLSACVSTTRHVTLYSLDSSNSASMCLCLKLLTTISGKVFTAAMLLV